MKLNQIDKEHTPELFYSSQDIDGNWIETEHVDHPGAIRLRKRCLNGWQDLVLGSGIMQIYFIPEIIVINEDDSQTSIPDVDNEVLAADGILVPQKIDWDLDDWTNLSFTVDEISTSRIDANQEPYDAYSLFDNGTDVIEVFFNWRIDNSKQTYRLSSTIGELVRMSAIVNDYREPEINVQQSFSDFLGLTLVETQTDQEDLLSTTYTFESDGFELTAQEPVFEVDPYLVLDEQSTYVDVTCDGYVFRCNLDGYDDIQDSSGTTDYLNNRAQIRDTAAVDYFLSYTTDRTLTVLENGSTRAVLLKSTNFETSGNVELPGSARVRVYYYIYPDRVVISVKWDTDGAVAVDDVGATTRFRQTLTGMYPDTLTNTGAIYESSGSEIANTSVDHEGSGFSDYIGGTSDEVNVIGVLLEANLVSGSADRFQSLLTDGRCLFGWGSISGNTTVGTAATNETHTMTVMWIIDSADRENGSKLYTSTERLEQGDQYTNPSDLTFDTGSAVTSGTGITAIGIDGFAADGAYHIKWNKG